MHRYVYKSSVFTIKTEVLKILLGTGEDQAIACGIDTFSWFYRFIKWLCSYSCVMIILLAHVWKKSDLEWCRKHKPIVHLLLETFLAWISRDSLLNQQLIPWLPFCWLCSTCVRAILQAVLKGDLNSIIFSRKETGRLPGSF